MKNIISVHPRATEKAYGLNVKNNVYVFDVPMEANQKEISAAIESQYSVKVESINTLVQKGKAVRSFAGKRRNPVAATRKDAKKAYVTLAKGDKIKVFDEAPVEEAVDKPAKKEKK